MLQHDMLCLVFHEMKIYVIRIDVMRNHMCHENL